MITYGAAGMKKEWRNFIKNLGIKVKFLHRDGFKRKYGLGESRLPAVFVEKDNKVEMLITAKEIDGCKSVSDLKELVREKIKPFFC